MKLSTIIISFTIAVIIVIYRAIKHRDDNSRAVIIFSESFLYSSIAIMLGVLAFNIIRLIEKVI